MIKGASNTDLNSAAPSPVTPMLREAFRFWLLLGFISFGGPAGQIAIMHKELVERRRWIGEAQFLHGLNFCMLLPGPEAQQLATYIGWRLHRTLGGLVAGTLFVLPSAFLLWLLAYIYVAFGNVGWIVSIFDGLKPSVLAIVAHAVLRIGNRALKSAFLWIISALAFIAIYFIHVPFPAIILGAGVLGFVTRRSRWSSWISKSAPDGPNAPAEDSLACESGENRLARSLRVVLICGTLWVAPIMVAHATLGRDHAIAREGVFFSKAAMVTFGGAYAVLPYVAQQAVEQHAWLSSQQMLDGLALAETTPGPLIMVLQFVGFLGAWNHPGSLPPLLAATLGAAMTTWVTFVPCFLWIFLGAPYVDSIRRFPALSGALTAITAAVVGVVLNLAVWFAGDVLWIGPKLNFFAMAIAVASFLALERLKLGVIPLVGLAAMVGLIQYAFLGH